MFLEWFYLVPFISTQETPIDRVTPSFLNCSRNKTAVLINQHCTCIELAVIRYQPYYAKLLGSLLYVLNEASKVQAFQSFVRD